MPDVRLYHRRADIAYVRSRRSRNLDHGWTRQSAKLLQAARRSLSPSAVVARRKTRCLHESITKDKAEIVIRWFRRWRQHRKILSKPGLGSFCWAGRRIIYSSEEPPRMTRYELVEVQVTKPYDVRTAATNHELGRFVAFGLSISQTASDWYS